MWSQGLHWTKISLKLCSCLSIHLTTFLINLSLPNKPTCTDTLIALLHYLCAVVDLVLIMSVNPGFGGQSFIESQVKKIAELRRLCAEKVYPPFACNKHSHCPDVQSTEFSFLFCRE
jgi:hypothetical protein